MHCSGPSAGGYGLREKIEVRSQAGKKNFYFHETSWGKDNPFFRSFIPSMYLVLYRIRGYLGVIIFKDNTDNTNLKSMKDCKKVM